MGRGSSGLDKKSGGRGKSAADQEYAMAYSGTEAAWGDFAKSFQNGVSDADRDLLIVHGRNHDEGFFASSESQIINSDFAENPTKTPEDLFSGERYRTVMALEKAINNNSTKSDGAYSRFVSDGEISNLYGLSAAEVRALHNDPSSFNTNWAGRTAVQHSYTETSASRDLNFWSSLMNTERRISVPKGTKAYAHPDMGDESEVIFARKMKTKLIGVSKEGGTLVFHEAFVGYGR